MRAVAIERRARPSRVGAGLALLAMGAGCGYTSTYVPPLDGRARPVWRENKVVVELSGAELPPSCASAVSELARTSSIRLAEGTLRLDRPPGGYWEPQYYGPPIFLDVPDLAPPLPVRPIFGPRLGALGTGRLAGSHPSLALGGAHVAHGPGGMHVSGGGGGGGGDGKGFVYLLVIALLVLPAVDVGVALADPEDGKASAQAIDEVNAFNDLARSPGSPCAWVPYAMDSEYPVPQPPPQPPPGAVP